MSAEAKVKELGIEFPARPPSHLAAVVQHGDLLFTSGHTSAQVGKCGADLTAEQGAEAARDAMLRVLASVRQHTGSLDTVRLVKVLGCVNCTPEFPDLPQVMDGASRLLHQLFGEGPGSAGHHARSALGFAQLPRGAAVEIEAVFALKANRLE